MKKYQLSADYKGACIAISFDARGSATLLINNLPRDTVSGSAGVGTRRRLTSPVQTDYEYHEFIEAILGYESGHIEAKLMASNIEITSKTFPITGDS